MAESRDYKWWYMECPICKKLDTVHGKCMCSLWKPKSIDGVCIYYKEYNINNVYETYVLNQLGKEVIMNYLESRLNEIETISAYNIDGRKEIFTQQLVEQGFHDGDTFSLFLHLSELILPRLKRYKELNCGYPGNLTMKRWDNILDKMIIAFELINEDKVVYQEKRK